MKSNYLSQELPLTLLQRRWWIVTIVFVLALWLGYTLLYLTWHPTYAQRWLVVAAMVLAYNLWFLWRSLKHNHRQGESSVLPVLGTGNALSLLRGLGISLLAGFLFSPWPPGGLAWLPALLYTLATIIDGLDGYAARLAQHATKLGELLDMEFDAVGLLIATALAIQYNQLPWWYLFLGLARYLFILGLWWRARQGQPVYDIPPSTTRRVIAGFHMGFTTVMLWPIVYPPATVLAGIVFAIPFIASFSRDWLVASGQLNPTSPSYLAVKRKLAIILTGWLPVLLRILVATLTINLILSAWRNATDRIGMFLWLDLPFPNLIAWFIVSTAIVATSMLALGVAGRLAALGLIVVAAANIFSTGLRLDNGLMLSAAIALMLLGSGIFSLWQPEDVYLNQRPGEVRSN